MKIKHDAREIEVPVKKVFNLGKIRGLMFRKKENSPALLFEFKGDTLLEIHSFFVSFPFLALWLDEKNKILEKKIVKPNKIKIKPKEKYRKLVEIPLNKKFDDIISNLVD